MRPLKEICQILDVFKAADPNPGSELEYHNAFTLLVAIVLSAQSTDKGVNKATKELFKIADTPAKMAALGLDKIKEHIKTIGLYNNKAKNILALSLQLMEKYNGEVPHDRAALEALPGVGRKTANVILNVWWKEPTVATPLTVEADLNKLPDEYKLYINHWLVLFGRYICKAQKPDCANCPVAAFCSCKDKRI